MTSNPIQAMFEAGVVERTDFPPESRYHGIPTATVVTADGTRITYLRRRFAPPPEAFSTLRERRVREGERLDQLAAAELGDPEAFWLICDANGAVWAEELEEPGAAVRITLPQDVQGAEEE